MSALAKLAVREPSSQIPAGLCQCGCGEPTRIAKNSLARLGHRAGMPVPYLPGHSTRVTPIDRFRSHTLINVETGCWIWTGSLTEEGYGRMPVKGMCRTAHRFAYLHFVGPVPDGLQLDHLCRVRSCANPDHLEPVTALENMLRGETTVARSPLRMAGAGAR